MDLQSYLLEPEGKDWAALLSRWSDVFPAEFTFWLANRFGDIFLVFDDGSVNLLRVDSGELRRLADNRGHFSDLINIETNANDWLMIPLVDSCVTAGLTLAAHQCYGFKIPPIFGGAFTADNVAAKNIAEYYAFLGDLLQQTKNVVDGTPMRLVVKESS